jgi:hypothetical protein
MKKDLGYNNFQWFDDMANIDYNKYKFSHTGYRRICSPITAGICMSDYENVKFASVNELGPAYKFLLQEDLDTDDMPEQISLNTLLWSRNKHQKMLDRFDLKNNQISKEDSLLILERPRNADEMNRKIELMALSSNLSRSFVQCQRSDLLRAGMYLLWHKGFKFGEEKINYNQLINHISEFEKGDYEMNNAYRQYYDLEKAERFYSFRRSRVRLMPRYFHDLTSYYLVRNDVVKYLRMKWLGEKEIVEDYMITRIKGECPWITDTSEEFFEKNDPIKLHRMINTIPTRKSKLRFLSRGSYMGNTIVHCMSRDNTSCDEVMTTLNAEKHVEEYAVARQLMKKFSARISRWCDIMANNSHNHNYSLMMASDIRRQIRTKKSELEFEGTYATRQEQLL